ncbi:MAG TPA: patatin-like phospholipase family protein [Anaeromyxobacteraceae bacterium]|nr:patatin-like phospholipase family protein [Anaeromyxobacteraceae bacterium]
MTTRSQAAAIALLACATARANAPASVTISGGVSLGSYEAGLLHYAIEAMRLNAAAATPRIVTGASAGSVNGFMSILQSCGSPVDDPTAGLFWNAWIPLGLEKLYDPKAKEKTSAFSRAAFKAPLDLIVKAWEAGLPESCDVVFGLSVTRLVPRTIAFEEVKLRLPRVEEHFVLRVRGRGAGKPPRLTNYVDPAWKGEQALLAEKDGEVVFPVLVDALFASTAFPGAFPPQPVRHCIVSEGAPAVACPVEQARTDLFVDGGVFDNTPVRLALRYAAAGLRVDESGQARWLDRPDLRARRVPESLVVAYVSTEASTFPAVSEQPKPHAYETLLGVAAQVGGSFYATARAKNLVYVQEDSPDVFERLLVPERHLPAASAPFGAFFGFFEGELRRFDFALGMYDARKLAETRLAQRMARAGLGPVRYPEDTPGAARAAASWRPYRCLAAVVDGRAGAEESCRGEELRDFRIVMQTTIEAMWDVCSRLGDVATFDADPLCRRARRGEPPLAVPLVGPLAGDAWRFRGEEGTAAYAMRVLAAHGFHFKDLGLSREEADRAPAALRARLLQVGDSIADTQPLGDALVLTTAVKMAADEVAYVPPRFTGWLTYGRDPEIGASMGFRMRRVFVSPVRVTAAVQFVGIQNAFSSESGDSAYTVLLGAEYLPSWWATTRFQPSLLLRGGWMFAAKDGGGFSACPDVTNDTIGYCSRPAMQFGVSASILELARLQLTGNLYFPAARGEKTQWAIAPGVGVQWPF